MNSKIKAVAYTTAVAIAAGTLIFAGVSSATAAAERQATLAEQTAVIDAQAAQIADLTDRAAALDSRLGVCLASAADYRAYAADNVAIQEDIAYRFGPNYMVPVKDIVTSYQSAADQLECD